MAISSLISGILGLICLLPVIGSLLAIVLGHMSHSSIKNSNGQLGGSGVAIAGFVTGYAGVVFLIPVMLILALSSILSTSLGWEKKARQTAILDKELRYTDAQFQYLGGYMKRKFADHSVLLIASPKIAGSSEYSDNRLDTIEGALKEAFDGKLTIAGTVHLEAPEDQDGMPPMFETMFTAEAFDEIVADNPEATLILSLVGLPMNWKEMQFWQIEDAKRPKLVITNGQVYELYDPIIQGYVNAVVHYNPSSEYNFEEDVPSDVTEAFEKRYLLIDADNIAKIAAENEGMFAKSP
jgi:UPF0716 family protein affecting phage T7 exclusion